MKPRLLDLFCGAGGSAHGYMLAGFHVTGVDLRQQPRYKGDVFIQGDALEYCAAHGQEYEAIHCSPPCQGYSPMRHLPWLKDRVYPLLLPAVLDALRVTGRPWVVENVERAPLDGLILCGRMFGLPLYRHRRFASNMLLMCPDHAPHTQTILGGRHLSKRYSQSGGVAGVLPLVTGAGHTTGRMRHAPQAMGIDWMTREELTQAIPPAYTNLIGIQIRNFLLTSSPTTPDPHP